LTLRRQKIQREIKELQEQLRLKEEELEDVEEIIRIKGPYVRGNKREFDFY